MGVGKAASYAAVLLLAASTISTVTGQGNPVCVDSCGLTSLNNAYSTYEASAAVTANKPAEAFPSKGSDTWQAYAISSALATVIILVICCCCCCFLCSYICHLRTRLDHYIPSCCCCIPGSPAESWGTSPGKKKWAWLLLLVCGVVWFILISLSFTYNTSLSNSVRDIPNILSRFGDFLSTTIAGDIECVIGKANAVVTEATALQSNGALDQSIIDDIIGEVGNFSDVLNGTEDGLLGQVNDAADQLRDTADSARVWTDGAGNRMEAFVYACLAFVLVIGLCNVCIGAFVGKDESTRGSCFTTLTVSSGALICVMWMLLLVCAIAYFVLRFEAGYCDDPFAIITDYIGKDDRSDPVTYYVSCADMSTAEREAFWPFEEERLKTARAFTNITRLVDSLDPNAGSDLTALKASTVALGCTVTANFGFLGFDGIFSCSNMQTFVQDIVIQLCQRMYEPLYSLTLCTLFLSILIMFTIWNQQIVRREPNFDNAKLGPNGSVMSPSGQEQLNPVYEDPPGYVDSKG